VRRALSLVACVALTLNASDRLVLAQAPSLVLNACHVSPIVHDLDVAAHFYHDVLGLDLVPAPPAGALPVDTDPGHLDLHGVPKARLRFIGARMPGVRCGIELVEFTGVDRRPVHRRYQDPGSTTLVLTVRNLDAAVAAVKKDGRSVVTTGGAPVRVTSQAGPARALTVQDPDHHYVELVQPDPAPETNVPATSNVIGIGLRLTVADATDAVAFYRRVLGIDGQVRPYEKDPARMVLAGIRGSAEFRTAMMPIPGSSRTLELVEFRGADSRKTPVPSRVQDPGSFRLQLTFRDIDATLGLLKSAGRPVVSTGGVPVQMTFGGGRPWRLAIVPDPNNLFLVVQQAPSPAIQGF